MFIEGHFLHKRPPTISLLHVSVSGNLGFFNRNRDSFYTEYLPDKKLLEEKLRKLTDLALEMGEIEETD